MQQINIHYRRGVLTCAVAIVLLFCAGAAAAQQDISDPPMSCSASSVFVNPPNLSLGVVGWELNFKCGTTDNRATVGQLTATYTITRVGYGVQGSYSTGQADYNTSSAQFFGDFFPGIGCLPEGDYTWTAHYECEYVGPTEFFGLSDFRVGQGEGATRTKPIPDESGTFSISPDDSKVTLTATLIDPPTAKGNVKIAYTFGRNCVSPGIHVDSLADSSIHVTSPKGEAIVSLPAGPHFIYATACRFDVVALSVSVSVPHAQQSNYFVQLGMSTDPDPGARHVVETPVTPGTAVRADVSLGSMFGVNLIKKDASSGITTIIPLSVAYAMAQQKVFPALETNLNLFANDVAVSLSDGLKSGTDTRFAAVHLGSFTLQMLPLTEPIAPITVTVNVVRPTTLGDSHNELDASIVDAAHERGIPPQILKGQIRQETGSFNPRTFRYEPCSADYAYVSRGQTSINTADYQPFAMDAALDSPDLEPAVDLRNQLFILDSSAPGQRRHITHNDRGVTAKQIWVASDDWNGHGQRWSKESCGALSKFKKRVGPSFTIDMFLDELDKFIAQTPTASSYGLMQVMYDKTLEFDWSVADPLHPGQRTRNPRYLVDTEEALKLQHGGSIFIGSAEDASRYNRSTSGGRDTYTSQEDFYDSFKHPLTMYTGGGKTQQQYGPKIIDEYQFDYLPAAPATVFH